MASRHAGPGSKDDEDNILSTGGAAEPAGADIGAAAGRGVCAARYGGQSAGDGGGGAGEDIQIHSLEVLTGIGELGVPRQRAGAMAQADYGPIEGHRVSMGAGLDSLCTAEGGAGNTLTPFLSAEDAEGRGNCGG